MMIIWRFPPRALRSFSLIFLNINELIPGILVSTFITGLSSTGFMALLNTFSITRGTVMRRYGFTSCIAESSSDGDGVLPRNVMLVPLHRGYRNSYTSPYMWAIGSIDTIVNLSDDGIYLWPKSMVALNALYVSITPLGALVVPEV